MVSSSNSHGAAKTTLPRTTAEEITLCTAWCNAIDTYVTRDIHSRKGFWEEVFAKFKKDVGGTIHGYDAIVSKWNILIRPKFVFFSVVYDSVRRMDENGSSDLVLFQSALFEYQTGYGQPFTMEACWRILKNHPACSYDLILDVVAAAVEEVEKGKKKVRLKWKDFILFIENGRGLMEACLPPESCSFGRCTICHLEVVLLECAIQNPTEVVNYTGAVMEASNVDLSRLCLGGVTDGSSLDAIFNHFTGKFDLLPSSQTANKMAQQKEKSCIAGATVANKEVAYDSQELLESSSRSVHRKRPPLDDPRTSQVLPEATSKKVTASVGIDHRNAVVVIVIRDTASQPLNTEPIPTNDAATQGRYNNTINSVQIYKFIESPKQCHTESGIAAMAGVMICQLRRPIGLMEACLPPESCSFGRCTICHLKVVLLEGAIQNPTKVVNYTGAVLEASNVDLSRLCLGGVTDGSSLGAIFNHFTGKFDLSPSSHTENKTEEQKELYCSCNYMVSNQFVQDHFHMPSLVAYDSPELLESSSRSVHRKRPPLDDPMTSQVLPEATSKKVTASVGTDHRKAVVVIVIRDTASQPLNTEPIPTNDAAAEMMETFKVSYKRQRILINSNGSVGSWLKKKIPDIHDFKFVSDVIKPLEIEELMDRKVQNLSGGELQRRELCICLGKLHFKGSEVAEMRTGTCYGY
nr:ABC transporter E family member 2-like [Tanacetum cinerariifolium]